MKKYMLGMGMICAASLAAAQTPKAEQVMDTKRQHIAEIAALTGGVTSLDWNRPSLQGWTTA